MYSYYSTFIVATSQMLFCPLPIASIVSNCKYKYSEQLVSHASEFVSIRVYCSILY